MQCPNVYQYVSQSIPGVVYNGTSLKISGYEYFKCIKIGAVYMQLCKCLFDLLKIIPEFVQLQKKEKMFRCYYN